MKCDKCKKEKDFLVLSVRNPYPAFGFPLDTEKKVCLECKKEFEKYISSCYDNFFK